MRPAVTGGILRRALSLSGLKPARGIASHRVDSLIPDGLREARPGHGTAFAQAATPGQPERGPGWPGHVGTGHGSLSRSAAPRCTSRAARHPPSSVSSDAAGALLGIEAPARRRGHGDEQQGPSARPRRRRSPRETPGTSRVPRGWPARVQNAHWCSAEKPVSTSGRGGAQPGRGRAGTRTGPGRWAGRCPGGNPVIDVRAEPEIGSGHDPGGSLPGRSAARGPCRQHRDY
jgi:hypothetical protein